jgi:hypothetical protein
MVQVSHFDTIGRCAPTNARRPLPVIPAALLYRITRGFAAHFIRRGCRCPIYMDD